MQLDHAYDDSSFNIHKLPNKNKPSEYQMKYPKLPDFSKGNNISSPKPTHLATKQLDSADLLSANNAISPTSGRLPSIDTENFLPFIQERDKLQRLITDTEKSLKGKLSPKAKHRHEMRSLVGNKLRIKLNRTPKMKISRDLAAQIIEEGQKDQEHMQKVIQSMQEQTKHLRANDSHLNR